MDGRPGTRMVLNRTTLLELKYCYDIIARAKTETDTTFVKI